MIQIAVDGFSLAEGTKRGLGGAFYFEEDIGREI